MHFWMKNLYRFFKKKDMVITNLHLLWYSKNVEYCLELPCALSFVNVDTKGDGADERCYHSNY